MTRRLTELRETRADAVAIVSSTLSEQLTDAGIDCRVFGREKRPYSIWRKLEKKGVSFDDIADIYAFRILTATPEDCYAALGVVHRTWRCVPERFHDYISTPKPNNYRSLHTTIIGPGIFAWSFRSAPRRWSAWPIPELRRTGATRPRNGYGYDPKAAREAGGDPLDRLRPFVEIWSRVGTQTNSSSTPSSKCSQTRSTASHRKVGSSPCPTGDSA